MKIVSSSKRILLAGAAALVLGGGALGVAAAQSAPAPPPTQPPGPGAPRPARQEFVQTLAAKLGVSVDTLRQALEQTRQEIGPRNHGFPGPHMRKHAQQIARAVKIELTVAAQYLGITNEELRGELRAGKSLAQVATAKGKSVQGLVDALASKVFERIDRAVADGKIPADRAQQMKQRAVETLTTLVNRVPPQRPGRPAAFSSTSL